MSEKKPKWEGEAWTTQSPNPVACETCMFRPTVFRGTQLDRASTDTCGIFEEPDHKPDDVYWNGAACEFYEKAL